MSILSRLKGIREVIIPFAGWEMFIMRLAFAWYFYDLLPDLIGFKTMPFPNSLGHWIDFTVVADPTVWSTLRLILLPCLFVYVCGFLTVPALAYMLFLNVAFGTLSNSQGAIGHTTQLVALVILAQLGMSLWEWILEAGKGRLKLLDGLDRQRRIIHAARVMIAAAYLTTAISKIDRSDGLWLWQTPNLSVQIVKTQANQYYNTLETYSPFLMEKLPAFIAEHPFASRVLFAPGLLIELFLFLGLMGRGWSAALGICGILLHRGIDFLMGLEFHSHEVILWIFYVNVPYWIVLAALAAGKAFRPRQPQPA